MNGQPQPLPAGASVLRVLEAKKPFFESPEHLEPTGDAFKPSTADIAEGERRHLPVGVSVFDLARTTATQAVNIRASFAARANRDLLPTRVFSLAVDNVRTIVRSYNPTGDVVADPLVEDGVRDLPGADGHAAIWGLYEPDKKARQSPAYKALLDRLAQAASAVSGAPLG